MDYKCPVCKEKLKSEPGKEVEQNKCFPFCSERCRLVDLGAWLEEGYRVGSESLEDEDNDDYDDIDYEEQ